MPSESLLQTFQKIENQIEALHYAPDEIERRTREIYETILRESPHIRTGNFRALSATDVQRLYRLYDERFFDGLLDRLLARDGEGPLTFRVSWQMTSAGGKTTRVRQRVRTKKETVIRYELAVSALLLQQTFQDEGRPITVVGVACADRLEALQRLVEHEMLHLLELLVWRESSCSRERFRRLANDLFAHTASKHALVTPREIAGRDFGINVGDCVTFDYQGLRYTGTVNRITKRATVLVEDPQGILYSDGRHYKAFYVPLPKLAPARAVETR
jgi:hypothetical protein